MGLGMMALLIGVGLAACCVWLSWQYETPVDTPVAIIRLRFGKPLDEKPIVVTETKDRRRMTVIPWIDTLKLVDLSFFDLAIVVEKVTAPDNVPLRLPVTLQFRPDPNNLDNFFAAGGIEGVKKLLAPITEQEVRQWVSKPPEGETNETWTWERIKASNDKLIQHLHDDLIKESGGDPANPNHGNRLLKYGVILEKTNVGAIDPMGEMAKIQELIAKETQEKKAEIAHTETQLEIARIVAERTGLSVGEAYDKSQQFDAIHRGHGAVYLGNIPVIVSQTQGQSGVREENKNAPDDKPPKEFKKGGKGHKRGGK